MSTRSNSRASGLALLAAACGALSLAGVFWTVGCKKAPSEPQTVYIPVNAKMRTDDLGIGLGYVRESEYTDEKGAKAKGLVAGLWIYVKDDASKNQTPEVREGQLLQVAGNDILVEALTAGQNGSVRLKIQKSR